MNNSEIDKQHYKTIEDYFNGFSLDNCEIVIMLFKYGNRFTVHRIIEHMNFGYEIAIEIISTLLKNDMLQWQFKENQEFYVKTIKFSDWLDTK